CSHLGRRPCACLETHGRTPSRGGTRPASTPLSGPGNRGRQITLPGLQTTVVVSLQGAQPFHGGARIEEQHAAHSPDVADIVHTSRPVPWHPVDGLRYHRGHAGSDPVR